MTFTPHRRRTRRGVSALWALTVLSIVSVMSVAAVSRTTTTRRQVDSHRNRVQAGYLARAGYEMAVERLLKNPEYTGETGTPVPDGEVKITVKPNSVDGEPVYHVTSEARYTGGRTAAVETVRRTVKRTAGETGGVRIEPVAGAK